ncbi:glycoside hydrolase family 3 protein [Acuticoccus kandeliae]|uniref:glycoside hydrolase family 3 protein n=1 Tax=Acuticoccus kandeliae TaxID=2073160 RepID=UPI000D3E6AD5|nr:glycoside hydrolase family 3 N-terminal domain-containing protein [Acuticoccus kandeliae]
MIASDMIATVRIAGTLPTLAALCAAAMLWSGAAQATPDAAAAAMVPSAIAAPIEPGAARPGAASGADAADEEGRRHEPIPHRHPMTRAARRAIPSIGPYQGPRPPRPGEPVGPNGESLEMMIGQMLMVGFTGDDAGETGANLIARHVAAGRLGGVLFFGQNVESADAVRRLTKCFTDASPQGLPVLLAVDQEGGRVERLTKAVGFKETPSARAIGTNGLDRASLVYDRLAENLAAWGFNLNLAPVVDLGVQKDNPVIARLGRAYSDDPRLVTEFARAFIEAHHAAGVLTALKHFPGHGSSKGDSHTGLVDISASWSPDELLPYRTLINEGLADMVLVAHVKLDTVRTASLGAGPVESAPATLSPDIIEGLLRGTLGYDGVVISDDMEMGSITDLGDPVEIAARAILAGNDILVFAGGAAPGRDLVATLHRRIREAAEADPAVLARIVQSYTRIAHLKARMLRGASN